MSWLGTVTGKKIDLLNPDPELVANHLIMAEVF